uniref:Uncharacterized protein n=1 Tax=Meloidogyne hapla TaxID=6305 RepID=A0A1I8BBG5_MELHA
MQILDPSSKDDPFMKSLLTNQKIGIGFYLDEVINYYKNARNRINVQDLKIKSVDEINLQTFGKIEFFKKMGQIVRDMLNDNKIDKKIGIVIPKWIEIIENILGEPSDDESENDDESKNNYEIEDLAYYYLEWLIGYSQSVRKIISEIRKDKDFMKLKKGISNLIGHDRLLNLEIAQPNVLKLR